MLTTQTTPVTTADATAGSLVQEFLNTPIVVVKGAYLGTSGGDPYYQANWVPILCEAGTSLCDPAAMPTGALDVRSGVIDSAGTLVSVLVQEIGSLQTGVQMYGTVTTDASGNEVITQADYGTAGAVPIYLDTQGKQTSVNTGVPVILSADSAVSGQPVMQVYVDPTFHQTFAHYGDNLLTNGDFGQQVPSNGSSGSGGWSSSNVDGNGGWRSSGGDPGGYFILNSNGGATDPTIAQTLTGLSPGATYLVEGNVQNIYSQYGDGGTATPSFGVYVNGAAIYTATKAQLAAGSWHESCAGSSTTATHTFCVTFTLDGGTTTATLELKGEQNGQDSSYAIDNLSVQAVNTKSYVTDFANTSGSAVPLFLDASGRKTATDTGRASVVKVYDTQDVPFVRTANLVQAATAGQDTLAIDNTGSSGDVSATLDTYQVPVDQLAAGLPVLHGAGLPGYYQSPDAQTYFGGEPVIDPLTGLQLTYAGGEPVRDLFTGAVVTDPSGNPLLHAAGDPMLHIAGDPVVQQRGTDVRYLGGEQVYDEQGNPVYTGSTPFTYGAGTPQISDRGQQVYDLVGSSGALAPIGAANFAPPATTFDSIAAGTVLDVAALAGGYVLHAGDQVSVLVYDGTNIHQLDPSHLTVSTGANTVTLDAVPTSCTTAGCVGIKLVIATPATHTSGQAEQYNGSEPVVACNPQTDPLTSCQPVLDASGNLQIDSGGNVTVYTSADSTQTESGSYYWIPSGGTQTIVLPSAPLSGLQIVIGSTALTGADYTLTGATLALHPTASLATGSSIAVSYVGPVLHGRGDPVYSYDTATQKWVQARYAGGEPQLTLGSEAVLYHGGEQAYYSTAAPVQQSVTENHVSVTGANGAGMPGDVVYRGLGAVVLDLGGGNDQITVVSTHTGSTTIDTGAGNDTVAVESTSGDTTVSLGAGNDTLGIGSWAGFWPAYSNPAGSANAITAPLTVHGGTGNDTVTVDDTLDGASNTGVLSSTQLAGIFGGSATALTYDGLESLGIRLGDGGNTFSVQSTHGTLADVATTTIWTGNGADTVAVESIAGPTSISTGDGADTITVGSDAAALDPTLHSLLSGIQNAVLTLDAGNGANTLNAYDSGNTVGQTGVLTATTLTGIGMTLGIAYTGIQTLQIRLGTGNDHFTIASTPVGSTLTLWSGDETPVVNGTNDQIDITSIAGPTTVWAGGGNDVMRVNYDSYDAQTFQNGIGALLTLHGGNGGDIYDIGLSGLAAPTGSPITTIDVLDAATGGDPGINQLYIYGTDQPDYFLLRANQEVVPATGMVAAFRVGSDGQPVLDGTMERVNYDGSINGGLQIYGRGGNDTFVLDDNLGPTTIFGGAGDDTFQIGQLFASPRDGSNPGNGLAPADYFQTTPTTQGYLSNGISYATTIFGGTGNDSFTVYHNLAELFLYGQEDNDTFVVRAFVKVNPNDPKAPFTNINGGQGADFISYTVDAPVRIDGGDGLDTLVVLGTEFGDTFVVTDRGVFGAGLYITYTGIEKVVVDGQQGNDVFYVQSTSPNVLLELVGSKGSDTFNIGGGGTSMPITVVSNSLQGHSGLVAQMLSSADVNYRNLPAQWISANVTGNDAPGVVISQVSPIVVFENPGAPAAMIQNRYSVVLAQAPTEDVRVVAAPTALSDQVALAGGRNILLNGSDTGVTLLFTRANWFLPQYVTVTAQLDGLAEGTRYITIQHTVIQGANPNDGGAYDGLPVAGRQGQGRRREHRNRRRHSHRQLHADARERPPRRRGGGSAGLRNPPARRHLRGRAEQAADRAGHLPGRLRRIDGDLARRHHLGPHRLDHVPADRQRLEHDARRLRPRRRRQHRAGPPLLRDHAGRRLHRRGEPVRADRERRRRRSRRRRQRRLDRPVQRRRLRLDRDRERPGLHRLRHRRRRHARDRRLRLHARVQRLEHVHAQRHRHRRRRLAAERERLRVRLRRPAGRHARRHRHAPRRRDPGRRLVHGDRERDDGDAGADRLGRVHGRLDRRGHDRRDDVHQRRHRLGVARPPRHRHDARAAAGRVGARAQRRPDRGERRHVHVRRRPERRDDAARSAHGQGRRQRGARRARAPADRLDERDRAVELRRARRRLRLRRPLQLRRQRHRPPSPASRATSAPPTSTRAASTRRSPPRRTSTSPRGA